METHLNPASKTLALLEQFDKLNTFIEVNEWDRQAKEEIDSLTKFLPTFDAEILKLSRALEQLHQEIKEKSFFARIFRSQRRENSLEGSIEHVKMGKEATEKLMDKLQRASDLTPNNPGEQREMLAELLLQKKKLLTSKKEVNCTMDEVKSKNRLENARAEHFLAGLDAGRISRIHFQLEKERALAPLEDEKLGIERLVIEIEKMMHWIEHFK